MKKFLLFLGLFLFMGNIYADGVKPNITFTLEGEFFNDVEKSINGNIITFTYTNNIDNMNLSNEQLEQILSQSSGMGASALSYYSTLKIDITPQENSVYSPLIGKTNYYRSNPSGIYIDNKTNLNIINEEPASRKSLNDAFWPFAFKVVYRTTDTGEYISTLPTDGSLDGKTLKKKISMLINKPENEVISNYKVLWKFSIPGNLTYLNIFDIYIPKDNYTPELVDGTTNEYKTTSLKKIDSYKVLIDYEKTSPTFQEIESEEKERSIILLPILILLVSFLFFLNRFKKSSSLT